LNIIRLNIQGALAPVNKFLSCLIVLVSLPLSSCAEEDGGRLGNALNKVSFGLFSDEPEAMVASAHPYATEAGLDIIDQGGNAIDAAIAVALVLTVVEPEASGIGGGTFLLYWEEGAQALTTYDGREAAPASAPEGLFLDANGTPKQFFDKVLGGKSVGVPGAIALYAKAHEAHGNLPWADLFEPAIRIANEGYEVSPKLHMWLSSLPTVGRMPHIKGFFTDDGVPYSVGTLIKNPDLASSLRLIAEGGASAFYDGPLTDEMIDVVANAPLNAAAITRADFASYEAKVRKNLCAPYRRYTICSMPPPSSGGLTVLQILKSLESTNIATLEPGSAEAYHLIAEASRLAFADRARYIADPDFVHVPVEGLVDPNYISSRSALMDHSKFGGKAEAGIPPGARTDQADDAAVELPSTSHFAVVDRDGNAVTATATVEFAFGSHLMAGGFILNNELTDFSALPSENGVPIANRVEPGKRPRSSMAPTFVFDAQGDLYVLIGSAGGSNIIGYVAKTLIGVLDWQMDIQSAINLPNVNNKNGATIVEDRPDTVELSKSLTALGHNVQVTRMMSGLHGIRITEDGFEGAADQRRDGVAESR
jgi:gamma-glutamyltranspeptidase/glutathione hydrolase